MKIEQDSIPANRNRIDAYNGGGMRIQGRWWRRSLILTPEEIREWPPSCLEEIDTQALEPLLTHPYRPKIVLIGTGEKTCFIDAEHLAGFYRAGVGVEVMNTGAACRSYNVLLSEERRVAAAFLIAGDGEAGRYTDRPGPE